MKQDRLDSGCVLAWLKLARQSEVDRHFELAGCTVVLAVDVAALDVVVDEGLALASRRFRQEILRHLSPQPEHVAEVDLAVEAAAVNDRVQVP